MALQNRMELQYRQELTINPRLYQAMDLLQMPLLDLQMHLKQELMVNPFLELAEDAEEGIDVSEDGEGDGDEIAGGEELVESDFDDSGSEQSESESVEFDTVEQEIAGEVSVE